MRTLTFWLTFASPQCVRAYPSRTSRQRDWFGSAQVPPRQSGLKGLPVKVGALRGSDSNRFYQRLGFRKLSEDEWDIYYTYGGNQKEDSSRKS